jgi:glycosyltransferase involved in cell wall biosynthesis
MKTNILNYEPNRRGGGWTQARYLHEGLNCVDYDSADVVLITGPTMAGHIEVEQAKRDGKKIVLRVDNAVRDSRNRGTGMSRLKAFCELADLVIYQSNWAKEFLSPFTKTGGQVILNGVDTKRFSPPVDPPAEDSYLYVRSSRDEGKQWVMAWYWFCNNPGQLEIVGKFSPENLEWHFDFFNGERFVFMGEQKDMPEVYRRNKHFLYTYTNEAGSNTLLEARASGCEIVNVYNQLDTGCGPEYMALQDFSIERMINEYREAINGIAV